MTARRLRTRVRRAVLALTVALAAAVVFKATGHEEVYSTIKELSPLVIAVLAAYLASRFQARFAFHASLRELWTHLIEAKNELIAYTMIRDAGPERFAETYKSLSKAIDEVRGVYRNVYEDDEHRGLFPYEPLHDMRKTLLALGPNPSAPQCDEAREAFKRSWDAVRPAFLAEFEPPVATRYITTRGATDHRMDDAAPPPSRWQRASAELKALVK